MLKLGIIGTNWITQQFVEAAAETKRYELVSVYSRTLAKAKDFGKKNGATKFFDDLTEFFKSDTFDTVYIASPNSLHFAQAKLAIDHGKNIIVEKPAFTNQKQMQKIQELLTKNPSVHLLEAARNVHTKNFSAIKKQVVAMDRIQGASFTYMKYSSRYDQVLAGETPNIFTLKFAGGALQDLGVYTAYDAIALFGMPDDVAYYPQFISTQVDGKGTAILRYPEFDVTLNFGKITNSFASSEIYGMKDTIVIDDAGELTDVQYHDEDGKVTQIGDTPEGNPMVDEANDFAEILEAPEAPKNRENYEKWLSLSINVNKVLFNLRQSGKLEFPDD
ncbi:hypothetical protein C5L31_001447 [Secundilactobacillus malefermentans]|uniref:Gfo/Idh/MocA-like oxidoreductase N-terminal domain-containing protein n=1 Tax=Secundilactobacillus malefermentans TaxID=176292 RepID=A0A4V3A3Z6_9LACO|nr:Gfo/Idh/MocA family oxidoreductase [Secundilactobacillus malefermentans]KRM60216.1 oxidoreductase domain-containing protein [Secundilactobacillus malefermentans DSM 5705 = KCTC 3548]TDG78261.1 hypothetical protein C5L31_001447 [Secundilactobacillus malefermentans]